MLGDYTLSGLLDRNFESCSSPPETTNILERVHPVVTEGRESNVLMLELVFMCGMLCIGYYGRLTLTVTLPISIAL